MKEYLIGTSGFSYEDWRNYFYPENLDRSDFLWYYSKYFKTTEINSTYYILISLKSVESMVRKTGKDFVFSVKANQIFTHRRDYSDTDIKKMKDILYTFDGKLGILLFQFPHSFHRTKSNQDYIKKIRDDFFEFDIAFEFRSYEWSSEDTYKILRDLDIALVCVDEPKVKGLPPPVLVQTTKRFSYLRFHGRNSDKWYKHERPEERYDYLYSKDELQEWAGNIKMADVKKFFIYFNNHPRAQAVKNAKMMEEILI